METLIFVYGTLRGNRQCGTLVEADRIKGTLYDLGGCPGFLGIGEGWVVGEVRSISPGYLEILDFYEGVARGLYTREQVTTEKGKQVWVYQINPSFVQEERIISSGDWFEADPFSEAIP